MNPSDDRAKLDPAGALVGTGPDTNARREAVLDRIDRFGMTTVADAHAHVCPEITEGGTRKWLERLAAAGWVTAYPLVEREVYYVAGPETVRARNLHPRKARAFGPQAKVTAYGTLLFCTRAPVRKLTAAEFKLLLHLAQHGLTAIGIGLGPLVEARHLLHFEGVRL